MKTLPLILSFVILTLSLPALSQKGKSFPELTGKTLTDTKITLPRQVQGKYALVGVAYSKKAEDQLNTWFQPVYSTFLEPAGNSLLPESDYDVHLYFIPMITGIAQSASDKIEDKMKKGIDKELHPYVLLYEGDIKSYKESLNMPDKDQPYFFVLDSSGKIIHTVSGAFSQKKLDQILEIVEE